MGGGGWLNGGGVGGFRLGEVNLTAPLAGALCNQVNREYSETTVGKGNWFPLYDPTVAASLANRDHGAEAPILLDPTVKGSGDVLEFNEAGEVHPRSDLSETYRQHIDWAIDLLGIRH